ncbi:hypothetical protein BH10PSE13_BH10PSE13_00080 [soil metagenome]
MIEEPTAEQADQCTLVQQEVVELINRLADEGFDRRVLMAGVSSATAAAVLAFFGAKAVPIWFAQQSALTMHLAKPQH